jgi:hypothetical protein
MKSIWKFSSRGLVLYFVKISHRKPYLVGFYCSMSISENWFPKQIQKKITVWTLQIIWHLQKVKSFFLQASQSQFIFIFELHMYPTKPSIVLPNLGIPSVRDKWKNVMPSENKISIYFIIFFFQRCKYL